MPLYYLVPVAVSKWFSQPQLWDSLCVR